MAILDSTVINGNLTVNGSKVAFPSSVTLLSVASTGFMKYNSAGAITIDTNTYLSTQYTSTWSVYAGTTCISTFNQSANRSITFSAGNNITLTGTAGGGVITISGPVSNLYLNSTSGASSQYQGYANLVTYADSTDPGAGAYLYLRQMTSDSDLSTTIYPNGVYYDDANCMTAWPRTYGTFATQEWVCSQYVGNLLISTASTVSATPTFKSITVSYQDGGNHIGPSILFRYGTGGINLSIDTGVNASVYGINLPAKSGTIALTTDITHYTSTWSVYAGTTLISTFNQNANRSITFKAGNNVTLTGTAGGGQITISATGGGGASLYEHNCTMWMDGAGSVPYLSLATAFITSESTAIEAGDLVYDGILELPGTPWSGAFHPATGFAKINNTYYQIYGIYLYSGWDIGFVTRSQYTVSGSILTFNTNVDFEYTDIMLYFSYFSGHIFDDIRRVN